MRAREGQGAHSSALLLSPVCNERVVVMGMGMVGLRAGRRFSVEEPHCCEMASGGGVNWTLLNTSVSDSETPVPGYVFNEIASACGAAGARDAVGKGTVRWEGAQGARTRVLRSASSLRTGWWRVSSGRSLR